MNRLYPVTTAAISRRLAATGGRPLTLLAARNSGPGNIKGCLKAGFVRSQLKFFTTTTSTSTSTTNNNNNSSSKSNINVLAPAPEPATSEDVAPLLKQGWSLITRANPPQAEQQQQQQQQPRATIMRMRNLRLAADAAAAPDGDNDPSIIEALRLEKKFTFKTYTKCQDFFNAIAIRSKVLKHHSSITVDYGAVTVRWTTHDAGSSVTKKDVEMAGWCEGMAKELGTTARSGDYTMK